MKLLIVCPHWFPDITGLGVSCYEFSQRLVKDGHQVTIIVPKKKGRDHKGMHVVEVPMLFDALGRNPIVFGLSKHLKTDADVILLYSYMFEMNFRVSLLKKWGVFQKPLILMYRGSLEDDTLPFLSPMTRQAKKLYDKTMGGFLFRNVDKVISNAKPALKVMKQKYKISDKKLVYISSALSVNDYRVSSLQNKRVLFMGRLAENKGVGFFEEICKQIPKSWKFTIVGNGPLEHKINALQRKYPQIDYKGKLSHDQVKKIYSKSDILVLPTFAEGSPRAVLEAMASGVPSVVFAVGDVPTLLEENKSGFCIEKYDIGKFCAALKKLIENSALRKEKGLLARRYAETNLEWDIVYPAMVKEIEKTIKKQALS